MRRQKTLLSSVAVVALLATPAVISVPTDGWAQLNEIVVTTRKREESLQDIPLSVTAFSAEQLDRQGIRDIQDVARLTPGLTFDLGFAPQDTRPQIRGLPSTRGRPPIGILLDGIDVSGEALETAGGSNVVNLRLLDIERVEVVKGPQSALYGRTAFGGAINYISKKPNLEEFEASGMFDIGNYGQLEARLGASGPIIKDKLGFRLNWAYAEHDGFYDNTITGEEIGGFESNGISAAFTANVTDTFTLTARVLYSDDESEVRPVATYSAGTDRVFGVDSSVPGAVPLGTPPNVAVAGGLGGNLAPLGITLELPAPVNLSANPRTETDYPGSTLETLITSVVTEWDLGFANFETWTGFTHADSTQFQDADRVGAFLVDASTVTPFAIFPFGPGLPSGTMVEPLGISNELNFETDTIQYSQEVRLENLSSDDRFRWAVGGLYWYEDADNSSRSIVQVLERGPSFFPPNPPFVVVSSGANALLNELAGNTFETAQTGRRTEHWSIYAHVEFDFLEDWTVAAEARYSNESYEYNFSDLGTAFTVQAFNPVGTPAAQPATFFEPGVTSADDDFITPRFTIEWDVSDDILLFASAAKGVKPGGFSTLNFDPALGIDEIAFEAETLWSYELGAKTSWFDNTLRLNVAGFYQDYNNKQDTQQIGLPFFPFFQTVVRNFGEARVWGIEVDGAWNPVESLTISGAYTYLDTEYTSFVFPTNSANDVVRGGNCTPIDISAAIPGPDACNVNLTGNELERQPNHAFAGTVSFNRPLPGTPFDILAEVSVQYQGERFLTKFNQWTLDSYTLVDVRLGLQHESWSAILYADNIFENDAVKSAQENFDAFSFGSAIHTFAPNRTQLGIRLGVNL